MGMISIMSMIDELGVREIMVVAHSHCGACHMSTTTSTMKDPPISAEGYRGSWVYH